MKKHVQTDSEWQEEMSQKIIDEIQCELYIDMPFMKLALSALSPKANEQLYSMATDGTYIYYNPIRLIDIFKKNGMYLNRAYLHSVLHCLFFHLWMKTLLQYPAAQFHARSAYSAERNGRIVKLASFRASFLFQDYQESL